MDFLIHNFMKESLTVTFIDLLDCDFFFFCHVCLWDIIVDDCIILFLFDLFVFF